MTYKLRFDATAWDQSEKGVRPRKVASAVEIEIDMPRLARRMGQAAYRQDGNHRVSTLAYGIIKARVIPVEAGL